MKTQFIFPAALALALAAGPIGGALAQDATTPPAAATAPAQPAGPHHQPRTFHSHIEGRVAYLKAELKITPAQSAQFDKLATAMRANDAERAKSFQDRRTQPGQRLSAVDRLDARVKMSQARTKADERYLAAFKPLYDSLSTDQKQAADTMLAPHRFLGGRGPHRG